MNDDEIGRALGTALTPPPVQAVADAGARLRARAAHQRRERALVGGSVFAVLGVLLAIGLVRVGGGGPPTPAASPAAAGYSLLTTPIRDHPARRGPRRPRDRAPPGRDRRADRPR